MLLFDAHLDLAMNALQWNRDITQTVAEIRLIRDAAGLAEQVARWGEGERTSTSTSPEPSPAPAHPPIGVILSMEGADPILSPDCLGEWWDAGLRAIGLSHYGVSRYAHG